MTTTQEFDQFLPLYDAVPDSWEEAKPFLVERLKRISEAVNNRTAGVYFNDELPAGNQYPGEANFREFRDSFRKVLKTGAIAAGANVVAHNITFDANFTLVNLYVVGTNNTTVQAGPITNDSVFMDGTDVRFTSPRAYERGFIVIEYLKEA